MNRVEVSAQVREGLAPCRRVPNLHSLKSAAAGEAPAVGADRQAADAALEHGESADLSAGGGVPEPHDRIQTTRGQAPAVGAERHAKDLVRVLAEGEDLLAGRG